MNDERVRHGHMARVPVKGGPLAGERVRVESFGTQLDPPAEFKVANHERHLYRLSGAAGDIMREADYSSRSPAEWDPGTLTYRWETAS